MRSQFLPCPKIRVEELTLLWQSFPCFRVSQARSVSTQPPSPLGKTAAAPRLPFGAGRGDQRQSLKEREGRAGNTPAALRPPHHHGGHLLGREGRGSVAPHPIWQAGN